MDAFTFALRQHLRTHGVIKDSFGSLSLKQLHRGQPCTWVIPEGAKAAGSTNYDFAGTEADAQAVQVVKLSTPVNCACGKLTQERIFVEGTMAELMTTLLAIEVPREVQF